MRVSISIRSSNRCACRASISLAAWIAASFPWHSRRPSRRLASAGRRLRARRTAAIPPRRKREPLTRSQMMARIRSKNTKPKVLTRSAVQALGLRFRNHVDDLPGKPDLANKTRKWAIFVHGCFWHSHAGCRLASSPNRILAIGRISSRATSLAMPIRSLRLKREASACSSSGNAMSETAPG
jgi:DNA mismatch endonuclease Vsr